MHVNEKVNIFMSGCASTYVCLLMCECESMMFMRVHVHEYMWECVCKVGGICRGVC